MRYVFVAWLVLVVLADGSPAWGDDSSAAPLPPQPASDLVYSRRRAPDPPASAWDTAGLRGFEVEALGGIAYGGGDSPIQAPNIYGTAFANQNPAGTILNPAAARTIVPMSQSFTPYSYDPFGFAFSAGYRISPAFSAGGFVSYANYGNNADPTSRDFADGTGGLQRVRWAVGAYGRYYFAFWSSRLQPWVQIGVGYVDDSASYAHPVGMLSNGAGPDNGNYLLEFHGLTLPLAIGLDWRLAPIFAVGPFVSYEEAIPLNGCVQITVDQTVGNGTVGNVNTCDGSVVQGRAYGNLLAGIFAKVTFDPLHRNH
jgi:hypothetical protein